MAIALHGTPVISTGTGITSLAVGIGSPSNNDVVVVLFGTGLGSGRTITPPSGYTQVPNSFYNTTGLSSGVYTHLWQTGDATSVTFSVSGANTNLGAIAGLYSNVPLPLVVVGSAGHESAATTVTSDSITPSSSADMLLMLYSGSSAVSAITWASPSEGAIEAQQNISSAARFGGAFVDKLLTSSSATGSQTIGETGAATITGVGFQVALSGSVGHSVALTATVGAAASLTRGIGKSLSASVASTAAMSRGVGKTLSASVAAAAAMIRGVGKELDATAAGAASMTRGIGKTLSAGLGAAGSISKGIGKSLSAAAAFGASMMRGVGKTLGAQAGAAGSIQKGIGKTVAAIVGSAASLLAYLFRTPPPAIIEAPAVAVAIIQADAVSTVIIEAPAVAVAVIVAPVRQ